MSRKTQRHQGLLERSGGVVKGIEMVVGASAGGGTLDRSADEICRVWSATRGLSVTVNHRETEHGVASVLAGASSGVVLALDPSFQQSPVIAEAVRDSAADVVVLDTRDATSDLDFSEPVGPVAEAAGDVIYGRGVDGYRWALELLANRAAWPVETLVLTPPDGVADLRIPSGPGPHPAVVLFHGGYWRRHWTRDLMDALAVDLTRRGWVTWNVEYRRIPPIGGWRRTIADAAAGAASLTSAGAPVDDRDVTYLGHSAGAQLAMLAAEAAGPSPPRRVVSLAGVLDVRDVYDLDDPMNGPARFLGSDGPSAFSAVSPIDHLPLDVEHVLVHGTEDDSVPVGITHRFAAAARASGDAVRELIIDGAGHMDLIDPASDAWLQVIAALIP